MKKVSTKNIKSRAEVIHPYLAMSLNERLVKSGSIDLRDNHTIEYLEGGYIAVHPIDSTKLIQPDGTW